MRITPEIKKHLDEALKRICLALELAEKHKVSRLNLNAYSAKRIVDFEKVYKLRISPLLILEDFARPYNQALLEVEDKLFAREIRRMIMATSRKKIAYLNQQVKRLELLDAANAGLGPEEDI